MSAHRRIRLAGLVPVVLALAGLPVPRRSGAQTPLPIGGTIFTATRPSGRPRSVIPIFGPDTTVPSPLLAPVVAAAAARKATQEIVTMARSIDYSGPRFGITYLPKAAIDSLKAHNISVGATITQFGWQFEREIHVSPGASGPPGERVPSAPNCSGGRCCPPFRSRGAGRPAGWERT
jgi:hypothetical protein